MGILGWRSETPSEPFPMLRSRLDLSSSHAAACQWNGPHVAKSSMDHTYTSQQNSLGGESSQAWTLRSIVRDIKLGLHFAHLKSCLSLSCVHLRVIWLSVLSFSSNLTAGCVRGRLCLCTILTTPKRMAVRPTTKSSHRRWPFPLRPRAVINHPSCCLDSGTTLFIESPSGLPRANNMRCLVSWPLDSMDLLDILKAGQTSIAGN